jgi:DNA-binding NarL/FixJ family response regulator
MNSTDAKPRGNSESNVTVVLAESHPLVRAGLRLLLEPAGIKVLAEAEDGYQALAMVQEHRPDILLSEVELPRLHAFDLLRRLAGEKVHVIIVSSADDEATIAECMRLGAAGFVLKKSTFVELTFAIDAVLAGKKYVCAEATRAITLVTLGNLIKGKKKMALTKRELIVMRLAAEGKTSREIATALFISPRTSESHRAKGMKKLGLRTQTELVYYALKENWISP